MRARCPTLARIEELAPRRLARLMRERRAYGWRLYPGGGTPVLAHREYGIRDVARGLARIMAARPHAEMIVLVHLSWSHEPEGAVARTHTALLEATGAFGGVRLLYLANTERELSLFRTSGLPAEQIPTNAFVDEAVFRPLPEREPRWDAVYDARLAPFKRHHLAMALPSLGCIVYDAPDADPRYAAHARAGLPRAHWFNDEGGGRVLSHGEVNAAYNRCRVGLCLSAEEGGMLASIQYLLAGLPVVTTPSIGGRDVFFDPEHVLVVAPEPEAVAAGVREMIARRIPAVSIRRSALARIETFRERFVRVHAAWSGAPAPSDWKGRWEQWRQLNAYPWTVGALGAFVADPRTPEWTLRLWQAPWRVRELARGLTRRGGTR